MFSQMYQTSDAVEHESEHRLSGKRNKIFDMASHGHIPHYTGMHGVRPILRFVSCMLVITK